jgi:nucleotide-binding universal stress UspA family protein
MAFQRIVVGYDGSPPARRAVEQAASVAADSATITVVAVVPAMVTSLGPLPPEQGEIDAHRQQLDEARGLLEGRSVTVRTAERAGEPAHELVEEARSSDADLVVVGTHGTGLAKRLVLGSVSAKVVREAPCDVLVVR